MKLEREDYILITKYNIKSKSSVESQIVELPTTSQDMISERCIPLNKSYVAHLFGTNSVTRGSRNVAF